MISRLNTLTTHMDDDGIMVVCFDHPDRSANTFTAEALVELDNVISRIERGEDTPTAVVFTSGKANVFINGADLFDLSKMDVSAKTAFLEQGQSLFERISKLSMTTVTAINGHCLGGGMELALACDWRVAADIGSINIGLPETKLGILPAWGGTTRLSVMIGPMRTLPLILAGKTMPPRKAQRAGLIHEVVPSGALQHAAIRLAKKRPEKCKLPLMQRLARDIAPIRNYVISSARKQTLAMTCGNYPAADKVIDIVSITCSRGHEAGLAAERHAIIELMNTDACRNLMRLFHLRQQSKQQIKQRFETPPRDVKHAVVIGGGTMGAGIVHGLIRSGISVRLLEVNPDAAASALGRVQKEIDSDLRAKKISPLEAEQAMHRLSITTDWSKQRSGLQWADIAIEAVAENMDIKRAVFGKLDALTQPHCILATNTSSLSVTEMSQCIKNPSRMIGLHFFNPVPKMPLVEVIRTAKSSDEALATGAAVAQRMGKNPIVVNDGPGFLVNRVLIPYLAQALQLAASGGDIKSIDRTMKQWGMPMGPYELLDQIGLDITASIFHSQRDLMGEHITVPPTIDAVTERGWLGKKTGSGFYIYPSKGKPTINEALVSVLCSGVEQRNLNGLNIADILVLPMINEAARLLDERVVDDTDTIDLATVLGLGLAPFRGGLIQHAHTMGLSEIVSRMEQLTEQIGPCFTPAAPLARIAASGGTLQDIVPADIHAPETTSTQHKHIHA